MKSSTAQGMPFEWKLAIAMMLSAALLMSGLFDTVWIQVLRIREVPREVRIGIAIYLTMLLALAASVAWAARVPDWWKPRSRAPWDWALKGILVIAPVTFLVGAVNGWPLTYLVGDLFLLTVMPLTYFTMTRRPLHNPKIVFRWIYGLMIFAALASTALVVYHNLLGGARDKMSLDAALGPIFYVMLKPKVSVLELLLLPVLVLASLLTTKRSTWAGIILVVCVALAMRPGPKRWVRLLLMSIGALSLVYFAIQYRPDLVEHSHTSIERRWAETIEDLSGAKGSDLAPTQGGRGGEVFGVFDTINARQNPLDWVTGLGLGAIVQARGGRERHHIHSTPAAFLARTGITGLFLWASFSILVWLQLARYAIRVKEPWLRTQFAFWLGIWSLGLVFSVKSLAFWGSIPAAIQVAYFLHLMRSADSLHSRSTIQSDMLRGARPRRTRLRKAICR